MTEKPKLPPDWTVPEYRPRPGPPPVWDSVLLFFAILAGVLGCVVGLARLVAGDLPSRPDFWREQRQRCLALGGYYVEDRWGEYEGCSGLKRIEGE